MFHMIQNCSIWRVFLVFAKNPTKRHHIRQISREIGLASTSVKRHIDKLIEEELVAEKKDVFKYYSACSDNASFVFYKKLANQIFLEESGLINYIDSVCTPDVIMLFGSFASGMDVESSDVDIYVQSGECSLNLDKYEKKIGRTIEVIFSDKIEDLPVNLANSILNGVRLKGFINAKIGTQSRKIKKHL
jgi:predicted nucleotidyltransferase